MAKNTPKPKQDEASNVLLLSGSVVSNYDSGDMVIARVATPAKRVSAQEKTKLQAFANSCPDWNRRYFLVEPLDSDAIWALIRKGVARAEANRVANEKRRAAEEKRQAQLALKRKQNRLAKLEALAKQA